MTLAGGVALVAALVQSSFAVFSAAWITVVVCGLPLLHSAVVRLAAKRQISSPLLICIAMAACIRLGDVFEAGEVAFIMAAGSLLEDFAAERAQRGIARMAEKGGEAARKMAEIASSAATKTAPTQRITDRLAAWLVPAALLVAVATWLLSGDQLRGLTVLVVFCPCALVLAAPVSIAAGIGHATKRGIIIRSGETLERLAKTPSAAESGVKISILRHFDTPSAGGSDATTELSDSAELLTAGSSDVVIIGDGTSKIAYLYKLARAVGCSIRVNICLALAINLAAVALSICGWLNPVTGALVHNAGSVLVVINAALLYDRKI